MMITRGRVGVIAYYDWEGGVSIDKTPLRPSVLRVLVQRTVKPTVVPYFCDVRPAVRVSLQTTTHQRQRGTAEFSRATTLPYHNTTLDRILLCGERRVASEKVRKKDTKRPNLGWRRLVGLLAKNFGRCVGCRAEK